MIVLAVYSTVYGYVQPYRSRLANLLEIAVNINFLLLLLINATSFFHDDMFIFSSADMVFNNTSSGCTGSIAGVAHVSWLLTPFYYFPLLGAIATSAVLIFRYCPLSTHNLYNEHVYLDTFFPQSKFKENSL